MATKFLRCPECGSANCELIVEPERHLSVLRMLQGAGFTKKVLQQKGHCLDCGCVWS